MKQFRLERHNQPNKAQVYDDILSAVFDMIKYSGLTRPFPIDEIGIYRDRCYFGDCTLLTSDGDFTREEQQTVIQETNIDLAI